MNSIDKNKINKETSNKSGIQGSRIVLPEDYVPSDIEEYMNENHLEFAEGNAIKYICRHKSKGKQKDIEKAIHYLQNELHHEENFLIQSGEGIPFKIQPEEFSYKEATYLPEESDRRGI